MTARRTFLTACGALAAALLSPRRGDARHCRRRRRRSYRSAASPPALVHRKSANIGDMFIQPDYDRWRRVSPGMTEKEVIALLGEPLERQSWESYIASVIAEGYTREQAIASVKFQKSYAQTLFPWTYGRIRYDSPSMPEAYEFTIAFDEGRVEFKQDPFDGHLSADGKPTTPELISPADNALLDHYPRFFDMRWMPSSGVYPMEYEVEISSSDPTTEIEVMSDVGPVTQALDYEVDEILKSRMPYVAMAFYSAGAGRWRVRAKNRLGVSRWSRYRYFEFEE
ncbi:MAG TPA: hypothetical protein VJ783_17130 [Pirellulales bacterium]|nr:hypothetical protein [Pirellulales bacterium]